MKRITLKSWITIIIIVFLSINVIRISGNPAIFPGVYSGLALSLIGILLVGLISDKYVAAVVGGLVIGIGIMLRLYMPIFESIKDPEAMEQFTQALTNYEHFLDKYKLILLALGIVFGYVCGIIGSFIKKDQASKFTTTKITYMGIFIAISVMINTLRIGSVSFGGFPIILSGYLLGPIPGFIVGSLADLLGFLIRPSSFAFNPLFTLTSALTGAIPVIVTKLLGQEYPKYTFARILIGVFIGQMLTSVIMVPIFSVMLFGRNTFWVIAGNAFIKQILSIPVYAFLITVLNDRFIKVIDFREELNK